MPAKRKFSVYSPGGSRTSGEKFECEKCGNQILVTDANAHWRQCVRNELASYSVSKKRKVIKKGS